MAETPNAAPVAAAQTTPNTNAAPKEGAGAQAEATETIKVNGKEVKLTRAQLVAAAQKGMFADQKLKSVDVLQGKTAALLEKLKSDPIAVLTDPALGMSRNQIIDKILSSDADEATKEKLSKWVYDNVVAHAKKSPEQLETEKKLSDYERLRKSEDDRKQQEQTAQQQAQVKQVYTAVRAEVTNQIVADKTFPQTEGSIRQVIEKLRVMNRSGAPITVENVTKAISLVKKDHVTHQQAVLDGAGDDVEQLISLIGEDRALKISRALVARVKSKQKAAEQKKEAPESPRKKITEAIDEKMGRSHGYKVLNF